MTISPAWYLAGVLALALGVEEYRLAAAARDYARLEAGYASYRRAIADARADDNARAAAELADAWSKFDLALAGQASRAAADHAELQRRIEEIQNAPADRDGPLAPVLRDTLERVWRGSAAAGAGDQGGANSPARRPAALPARP